MKDATPQPILLKNYRQPSFWIPNLDLHFNLGEEKTVVRATLKLERNEALKTSEPVVLAGEELTLKTVKIDGRVLAPAEYTVTKNELTILKTPDHCTLEIETELEPQKNLSCEGLYKSSGMFCTQCEAESFRRITYFLDRPDVMSVYTVTIEADKTKYPQLLSNGNRVDQKDLANGRHQATWHDPHKKPCYLFALVAGDLGVLEDEFVTRSGRKVRLQIFARHGQQDRCQHAMDSLKWAMHWDEDTYGLEYDLDTFMIVVADDFNMGAMENKGLNVFNANYVLAKPETATDHDYDSITAIVGHEYFHNWTGNRVTCRDWFQLSLKEGLTVFRDQRFSSDMASEAVNRIEEVVRLRTHQFAEDSGPMAHPIRPHSYISINNFYTTTVYEKGAEVIRMIQTIVGRDGFRAGMDLYFKRHDGQAVTTEDFVKAMADANGIDLTQFKNWYDQAGTPVLDVSTAYDAKAATFKVTIAQSCPPTPGQDIKKPYHMPIAVGLLAKDGKDMDLQLAETVSGVPVSPGDGPTTLVLHLREPLQTFTFVGVKERPVLSFLRNFSAPVRVKLNYTDDELAFLMAHDSDAYARWEAAQILTVRVAKELVSDVQAGLPLREPTHLVKAFAPLLKDATHDGAFSSFMLSLPAEQYLAQFYDVVDIDAIHKAREHMMRAIATAHKTTFARIYDLLAKRGTEGHGAKASGDRAIRGTALMFLTLSDQAVDLERAVDQRRASKNMTDELAALSALNRTTSDLRDKAFNEFYEKWKHETLVMNKWLTLQAIATSPHALAIVKRLANDPVFDKTNPNKIYSLYVAFSKFNLVAFHNMNGEAYKFIADQILDIDSRNPQVASRLMDAFSQWRKVDVPRQTLIRDELLRILAKPGLSNNVFEIASKTLG